MNKITKLTNPHNFFDELFDYSDEDPVDIKKTSIASNFCALIHHAGLNRSELAERLNWKPSRVSKVLSGTQNLTIKTMVEISVALEYDFDIHFHKPHEHRNLQPWEDNLLKYLSDKVLIKKIDTSHDNTNFFINIINDTFINYGTHETLDVTPKRLRTRSIL